MDYMDEKTLLKYSRLSQEELFESIETPASGLDRNGYAKRLKTYGLNVLVIRKTKPVILEFLKNFSNPLVIILLFVATLSLFLGDTINAAIVFTMIILSVCLNFFQEHRATRAAQKLQDKVALMSVVLRDGKEEEVKATSIVPGDILVLNAGDLIPADARIIESKDFFVNQSALTGESFPVEKSETVSSSEGKEIPSLPNMIFAGTNVITGGAKAVVLATGFNTEFGKIAKDLDQSDAENSFSKGIKQFSIMILRIVIIFVLFIFAVNSLLKHNFLESLTFAIAIAVGLTPEFLPMIMSVTMSRGALEMAKKGVIVKKLTAIPTFGSMDVLCTDKTGTITEDKIKLVRCVDLKGVDSEEVFQTAFLNSHFQTGITNPLDQAILSFKEFGTGIYKKVDEIPFDFERKMMSVVLDEGGKRVMIAKGAPDEVMNKVHIEGGDLDQAMKLYNDLSKEGFRVLAIAKKNIKDIKKAYDKVDEFDFDLVGFTAFLDPVKSDVKAAIDRLEEANIEIKIITGDNELVAQKSCKEAGVDIKGIILGHEIDGLNDQELGIKARDNTLFARFSPAQKSRVISSLRGMGYVVGYMGDGVNDAPSLKSADVGISVENAVDVAKETAEIILTHQSLMELIDGVIEGRKIFGNTMKYIMMGLSSNFGNMFSVLGAVIFLPFLPMLPIQILLNNFLYDLGQLTIPNDNVDPEYLKKPKKWDIRFVRKFMIVFGPISSIFDFTTFFVMYILFSHNPSGFQTAWFMESLATQTLVIHIIRTRKIPFLQSRASIALIVSTSAMVILGWLIPFSSIGHLFSFTPLPGYAILILVGIVLVYLMVVEIGKRFFYRNINKMEAIAG